MKKILWLFFFYPFVVFSSPHFTTQTPKWSGYYQINGEKLCLTAKNTLAYLDKGYAYDSQVLHKGKVVSISVDKIKATLKFICLHQHQLNNPTFIKKHFAFIRWYPDAQQAKAIAMNKPLLKNLPNNKILMTKYYVHLAQASIIKTDKKQYPLYGLPKDEQDLTLEQAEKHPHLLRFQYGKQSILRGALDNKKVPVLGYFNRDDLEAALLQGTVVADFGSSMGKKIFNVHRCNNIPYDKQKGPYEQERYWYFKQVDGIKGYGKDAEHKITVEPTVTFAADLPNFGLGKLLLIQYKDASGTLISKAGVLADTGGAFANNLYQIDYLAGSYAGKTNYLKATRHLPDYVDAYFMVLK